jgi:transposase
MVFTADKLIAIELHYRSKGRKKTHSVKLDAKDIAEISIRSKEVRFWGHR